MENLNPSLNTAGIITLMYHRIDDPDTDPWGICVSPDHFEEHISFLKNNFTVISTGDLISQLTNGNIIKNSICITFDDGYTDNYVNAKPILEQYNCPATFFIPTAFIDQSVPFWWDELELIFLHSKNLPCELILQIDDKTLSYTLDKNDLDAEQIIQHATWKWHQQPPTKRCEVFLQIWEALRPLSNDDIIRQMAGLRQWANLSDAGSATRLPMTSGQLRALSKNPLFTIAMHTHSHMDLEGKEKNEQVKEILSCKNDLSDQYGIESNCLAYPYGRYDANTIDVVKTLGIDICFTTVPNLIQVHSDRRVLGRYQVFNGNKERLAALLNFT